jgi:hypothetical protein
MRLVLASAALVVAVASVVHGELSPATYQEMRDTAPEVLTLQLGNLEQQRTKAGGTTTIKVSISATVQAVRRSKAGLKPGDRLTIAYQSVLHDEPVAGIAPTPILRETPSCTIYLKPAADAGAGGATVLSPAAHSQSFVGCYLAPW